MQEETAFKGAGCDGIRNGTGVEVESAHFEDGGEGVAVVDYAAEVEFPEVWLIGVVCQKGVELN